MSMLRNRLIGLAALCWLSIGSAYAVPYTWVADKWEPNVLVSTSNSAQHTFNILWEGFRPDFDLVTSATLRVGVKDDSTSSWEGGESVKLQFDNGSWTSARTINRSLDFSLEVPKNLLLDGLLKVIVKANTGDFKLLSASLTVYGDRRTSTAVPEPGTSALLGLALLGIASATRRRKA